MPLKVHILTVLGIFASSFSLIPQHSQASLCHDAVNSSCNASLDRVVDIDTTQTLLIGVDPTELEAEENKDYYDYLVLYTYKYLDESGQQELWLEILELAEKDAGGTDQEFYISYVAEYIEVKLPKSDWDRLHQLAWSASNGSR